MGLLEKALKYKSEMNRQGRETLIDRIQGPADTDFIMEDDNPRAGSGSPRLTSIEQVEDGDGLMVDAPVEPVPAGEEITYLDESLLHELDPGDTVEERPAKPIILDDMDAVDVRDEASGDDIFSLPEEEATRPEEVLRQQKAAPERKVRGQEFAKLEAPDDAPVEPGGYRLSPDDPFGMEDAPALKAVKEKASGAAGQRVKDRPAVKEEPMVPAGDDEAFLVDETDGVPGDESRVPVIPDAPESRERQVKRDKRFQDFLVLYEIGKEILRSENRKELYDVVLFSIMGQIGASSSSIMVVDPGNTQRWIIGDSRGVTIRNKKLYFDISEGILGSVIARKTIIDLDEFKERTQFSDEYYKFVSVDARLLSPLSYGGTIIGAIVLGEKLSIGDYSEEEKDFIGAVSEITAIALSKVNQIEKLQEENGEYRTEREYLDHMESFKARIVSDVNMKRLDEIISTEFSGLGIVSYSVFMDDEKNDRYEPVFVDRNDELSFRSTRFSLPYASSLIEYISELRECVKVEDHKRLKVVTDMFPESRLKKMSLFWIYPFKFGSKLAGFLLVTDIIDMDREKEIHAKLTRLSTVLVSYIMNLKALDINENRYADYIEPVLKRIDHELQNARSLRIPMTVILFSIKNFKRYYALYGREEARKIIDSLEEIIRSRLSDPDFSVRYDRSKLLIVLPGKNKKYAVPLANTIRNEIIQHFKKKEMQLLVTFLTAEYPEDGEDLHALLDVID
jgi:diguanylate cyclase (GGDEF)-like protein